MAEKDTAPSNDKVPAATEDLTTFEKMRSKAEGAWKAGSEAVRAKAREIEEEESGPKGDPFAAITDGDEEGKKKTLGDVVRRYYANNPNAVVYGVVGVLIALGILIFGLIPVCIVVVFAIAGITYGQYRDGNPRMVKFFNKHFGNDDM